ncbi:MAG: hypothetical protein ABI409_20090, partial [Ramlibacter sp.]
HERMTVPLRPATLHPRYVAADARRNGMLRPVYLSFESQGEYWLHSFHMTDIPGTDYADASSPYGYGGPLCSSDHPSFLDASWLAYLDWMRSHRAVVEYIRFHPILGNERHYGGNVLESRQVVWLDLQATDMTDSHASRLRQGLKKAAAVGLVYEEIDLATCAREFAAYYRAAMREMNVDPFYLFDDAYFEGLAGVPRTRVGICRPRDAGAGEWLAAALFIDGRGVREYHLAGSNQVGRSMGASGFLLNEGALAARQSGLQKLYLGGGTDASPRNPLLFFKSAFSRERLVYRTGWTVFNDRAYDELQQRFPRERLAHPDRPIFHRIV